MAKLLQHTFSKLEPGRIVPVAEPVLHAILFELRAIRTAIEHPKETALKEIRETVTT